MYVCVSHGCVQVSKAASERLQTVLVAVRQGAVGLAQRLAPFNSLLGFDEPDALAGTQASLESTGRMLVCQPRRVLPGSPCML